MAAGESSLFCILAWVAQGTTAGLGTVGTEPPQGRGLAQMRPLREYKHRMEELEIRRAESMKRKYLRRSHTANEVEKQCASCESTTLCSAAELSLGWEGLSS